MKNDKIIKFDCFKPKLLFFLSICGIIDTVKHTLLMVLGKNSTKSKNKANKN